jgi:hypothetical protein
MARTEHQPALAAAISKILACFDKQATEIAQERRDICDFVAAINRQARELQLDVISRSRESQVPERIVSIAALCLAALQQEFPDCGTAVAAEAAPDDTELLNLLERVGLSTTEPVLVLPGCANGIRVNAWRYQKSDPWLWSVEYVHSEFPDLRAALRKLLEIERTSKVNPGLACDPQPADRTECEFVGGSLDNFPEICDRCGLHFDHPSHHKPAGESHAS